MGKIYEEIEVEGEKVIVKIDTASDFELALRKEVIEKLKLKRAPFKAKVFREEEGKMKEYSEPMWFARTKIKGCEFPTPLKIIEASGENLLGHPILQALSAKIDEENKTFTFEPRMCPKGFTGELRGKIEDGN
jgi:predicted aspartyl protease